MALSVKELRASLTVRSMPGHSLEAVQIGILIVNMLFWGAIVLLLAHVS